MNFHIKLCFSIGSRNKNKQEKSTQYTELSGILAHRQVFMQIWKNHISFINKVCVFEKQSERSNFSWLLLEFHLLKNVGSIKKKKTTFFFIFAKIMTDGSVHG